MKTYFVINELPNNTWAVTWPGYEYNVVNNTTKARTLMEILFEHVGVERAMIFVHDPGRDNDRNIMHISSEIWWLEDHGRNAMADKLARYVIPGVVFRDQYEAEKFKLHMEQRLLWRRLGGKWKHD